MPSDLEEVGLGPTASWAFIVLSYSICVSLSCIPKQDSRGDVELLIFPLKDA